MLSLQNKPQAQRQNASQEFTCFEQVFSDQIKDLFGKEKSSRE